MYPIVICVLFEKTNCIYIHIIMYIYYIFMKNPSQPPYKNFWLRRWMNVLCWAQMTDSVVVARKRMKLPYHMSPNIWKEIGQKLALWTKHTAKQIDTNVCAAWTIYRYYLKGPELIHEFLMKIQWDFNMLRKMHTKQRIGSPKLIFGYEIGQFDNNLITALYN